MHIEIRPYRESDHADVARIWHAGWQDPVAGPQPPNIPANLLEELSTRIPRELNAGWTLFVATGDERVVGMLAVKLADKHLDQLFVDPSFRSCGIGKQLLDFTKAQLCDGFWLRTHVGNLRARKFYEREGLTHVEDKPHPRQPEVMNAIYRWNA